MKIFGPVHISLLLSTLAGGILLYIFSDKLKKWKHKENVRYIMAAVFFVNMAVYYLNYIIQGVYNWKVHLPLHLCFITGYIFMYILITNNKKLYKIVYFFTFIGPLPAMIWPDMKFGADNFVFYQFIISHHLLLLTSLYCLFVLDYDVKKSDIPKAFLCGNILVLIMFCFNSIFDTNYIMMYKLPDHIIEMYPFVTKIGSPILWLELVGILAMTASYIPAAIKHLKKEKQRL